VTEELKDVTEQTEVGEPTKTYYVENNFKYRKMVFPGGYVVVDIVGDAGAEETEYIPILPLNIDPSTTAAERITALEVENASMALELALNQIRFDQMEQANADLLFSLVDKGVL
jgi:hypothetical protein